MRIPIDETYKIFEKFRYRIFNKTTNNSFLLYEFSIQVEIQNFIDNGY